MLPRSLPRTAALCSLLALAPVQAHVTLEYGVAPAGASYKATFKVGHGCDASPTRQVTVEIPAGVRGARPMPKPGWTIEIQREKLAQPSEGPGRTVTEDVARITWTAKTREDQLDARFYDEFALVAQLPAREGTLYWPIRQVCEAGRIDWVDVPRAGERLHDLKAPAAALELLPGGGGHNH